METGEILKMYRGEACRKIYFVYLCRPKKKTIMYAVVNIQGNQFKVEAGQKLYINRLADDTGATIEFGEVLLLASDDDAITVGKPLVEGASVRARVLDHLKGDKVIVFKKKRRKGYRVKNGHRQYLSQIEIESINA